MPEFRWFKEPKFHLSQDVYAAWGGKGFGKVDEGRVFQYRLSLWTADLTKQYPDSMPDQVWATLHSYYIGTFNPDTEGGTWPESHLFASKREAKAAAEFHKVTLSSGEWEAAIGTEADRGRDGCELGVCCAEISGIRDTLFRCQEMGGLIDLEAKEVGAAMKHHDYPEGAKVLREVWKMLGLKWGGR